MPIYQVNINNKNYSIEADDDMPLLWVLRDFLKLTGTKYGCGLGICGSCMVHADDQSIRSCLNPISSCVGKKIITIEGLSKDGEHPVQIAWKAASVPQCGYCQSGQMMQAAALLAGNPKATEQEIKERMSSVLCRCGTYPRIKKAIKIASKIVQK